MRLGRPTAEAQRQRSQTRQTTEFFGGNLTTEYGLCETRSGRSRSGSWRDVGHSILTWDALKANHSYDDLSGKQWDCNLLGVVVLIL